MNELIIFVPVILGIYLFANKKNKSSNITAPNISENYTPAQLKLGKLPSIYNNSIGNYFINPEELNIKNQISNNKLYFTSSMCKFSGGMSNSLNDMINKINGFSK